MWFLVEYVNLLQKNIPAIILWQFDIQGRIGALYKTKPSLMISVEYYAVHDGLENICVKCPKGYTTPGPGAMSMDNCSG